MRILLTPFGTRGDVQPVLALGVRLAARGHRVTFQAAPNFREWIERDGITFVPSGPDVETLSREMGEALRNPLTFAKVGLSLLAQQYKEVTAAARDAEVIVGAGVQVAGTSVAESLGVPYFYAAYCPQILPSRAHAPMTMPFCQDLPRAANALPWAISSVIGNTFGRGSINRERAKLGLAPIADLYRSILTGTVFLAFDDILAPAPTDSGIATAHAGPWFLEDGAPLPDDVDRFLRQPGAPVVYVGFGSMVTRDSARLTELVVEAAARASVRVLVSAGWAGIGGGDLPPHALAVGALSHASLLPRVAAAIHHGGAGTTHSALRAGVPQVIVPHLLDQYYWARRVPALGIGVRTTDMSRLTARGLATAIRLALDPAIAASARRHGVRVRAASASGLDAAVARIEATATKETLRRTA